MNVQVTEDEATKKVCPLMPTMCQGSRCMAWVVVAKRFTGENVMVKLPDGGGKIEPESVPVGCCGMVAR